MKKRKVGTDVGVGVGWAPDSLKGDAFSYPVEFPGRKCSVQSLHQHCLTDIEHEPHMKFSSSHIKISRETREINLNNIFY